MHGGYFNLRDRLMSKFQVRFTGVIYLPRGTDFTVNKTAFWNMSGLVREESFEFSWDKLMLCFETGYRVAQAGLTLAV